MQTMNIPRFLIIYKTVSTFVGAETVPLSFRHRCHAPLVWTNSGKDPNCQNAGNDPQSGHYWPLMSNPEDCHGWFAYDHDGKPHLNSANNIRCSEDGNSLLYTQYPDTLNCQGGKKPDGEEKEFVLEECHPGIPTGLWDIGLDLNCCKNPDSEACKTGFPHTYGGADHVADVYLNGEYCGDVSEEEALDGTTSSAYSARFFQTYVVFVGVVAVAALL